MLDVKIKQFIINLEFPTIIARADADRQIHQAQALWSACSALWSSMRSVDSSQSWQHQLRPLKAEVEAVRKASGIYLNNLY